MPRRHTGEQRCDELIVSIVLGGANERADGINAEIPAGTYLLAMKIMKLDQNVCT